MRPTSAMVLGGLALAGVAAACGYPEFEFRDKGGGGSGASTSTSTGGSGGAGTGTASGTGTATGGTGGSGNAGGTEPGTCAMWPEGADGCPEGQKCSVVSETIGRTECVTAGPQPPTARCNVDADCVDRTWCDHATGVCKWVCQSGDNCPVGGTCANAQAAGSGTIPGLQVCTAYCDPRVATSCNQSNGTTNCLYGSSGFDCFWSGNKAYPNTCGGFTECGPPQTCYLGFCRPWCDDAGHACPVVPGNCYAYPQPIHYGTAEMGYCSAT